MLREAMTGGGGIINNHYVAQSGMERGAGESYDRLDELLAGLSTPGRPPTALRIWGSGQMRRNDDDHHAGAGYIRRL